MKNEFQLIDESKKIVKANFISRPNRFVLNARLEKGSIVQAHVPNSGRMRELLYSDAPILLQDHRLFDENSFPLKSSRKYPWSLAAAINENGIICLDTSRNNEVVEYLLKNDCVPGLEGCKIIRKEVPLGNSRMDFLLEYKNRQVFLEVKSCTLFENGIAVFPDAPTKRGLKHLSELAQLKGDKEGAVLFLIHSHRVNEFSPCFHRDPEFSQMLMDIREKIRIIPLSISWKQGLTLDKKATILPVDWNWIAQESRDRGSYILHIYLDSSKKITVGSLGELYFEKGFYLYVGSGMNGLKSRINRHLRKSKKFHWHIDFLLQLAHRVEAIPILSSTRAECDISLAMAQFYSGPHKGFGSTDCKCLTHLYHSASNPWEHKFFNDTLGFFRFNKK